MLFKLQPFICLSIALFLIGVFIHDLYVFHKTQIEKTMIGKKEKEVEEKTLSRLKALIRLVEEEDLDEKLKKRLIDLNHKLNE